MTRLALALALALLAALRVGSAEPVEPTTERPSGGFATAQLTLKSEDLTLIAVVSLRDGRAQSVGVRGVRHPFLASDLRLADGRLTGQIRDAHPVLGPGQKLNLRIDAAIDDAGSLSGRFEGRYNRDRWNAWTGKQEKPEELDPVSGSVSGRVASAPEMRKEQAFAEGPQWPAWEGPTGNCVATDTGARLVDDLKDARLVWKSEAPTPGAPGPSKDIPRTMGNAPLLPYCGGGATPVIGDNKVFLRYTLPAGETFDKKLYQVYLDAGYNEAGLARGRKLLSVSADDAVACFDARTGQLLWRTTFPDAGLNFQGHKIAQNNLSALHHDGRVFAIGSTLRFYALDADTGEVLWQSDLGERHRQMEEAKAEALREGRFLGGAYGNRSWGFVPVAAAGLVVCNNKAGGLVAFDPESGVVRWTAERCADDNASPRPWTSEAGTRLIIPSREAVHCLDAPTGRQLWALEKRVGRNLSVTGDRMAFRDHSVGDPKTLVGSTCALYRLTDAGPEPLWTTPWTFTDDDGAVVKDQYSNYVRPLIHGGRLYLSGRVWTDCLDLATGRRLARIAGEGGVANAGHLMLAEGRLFLNRDGKHAKTVLAMYDADPDAFAVLGEPETWSPPHPNTTSYGPYLRFPVVDGRMFIRGNDAVYCYDLRENGNACCSRTNRASTIPAAPSCSFRD